MAKLEQIRPNFMLMTEEEKRTFLTLYREKRQHELSERNIAFLAEKEEKKAKKAKAKKPRKTPVIPPEAKLIAASLGISVKDLLKLRGG